MGEFFHGWQRKIGVIALLMACVATTGWIRSQSVSDNIDIPLKTWLHNLNSRHGNIVYCRVGLIEKIPVDVIPEMTPVAIRTSMRIVPPNSPQPTIKPFRVVEYAIASTRPLIKWTTNSDAASEFQGIKDMIEDTHQRFCGIEYVVKTRKYKHFLGIAPYSEQYVFLTVPYWSVVIPLTLISAWMLLSKPRHSNVSLRHRFRDTAL